MLQQGETEPFGFTVMPAHGHLQIGCGGAPAKGTVVLNYCHIGTDLCPAVIDSTRAKQGWHVPGTHQPILPPEAMQAENPDVLLLLAWNHAQEILRREAAFVARGGIVITPHEREFSA